MDIEKTFKSQCQKALEYFEAELGKIRTGRAHPSLVEDLSVDYYGAATPLKQIASVSTPEPRIILIQPWDKNAATSIEKTIQKSNLGLNPVNEGDKIRIILPPLTEETRLEMAKMAKKKKEEAKIAVRSLREEAITAAEAQSGVSEDQIETAKEKIQKLVEESNEKIETAGATKEKEIMTI